MRCVLCYHANKYVFNDRLKVSSLSDGSRRYFYHLYVFLVCSLLVYQCIVYVVCGCIRCVINLITVIIVYQRVPGCRACNRKLPMAELGVTVWGLAFRCFEFYASYAVQKTDSTPSSRSLSCATLRSHLSNSRALVSLNVLHTGSVLKTTQHRKRNSIWKVLRYKRFLRDITKEQNDGQIYLWRVKNRYGVQRQRDKCRIRNQEKLCHHVFSILQYSQQILFKERECVQYDNE